MLQVGLVRGVVDVRGDLQKSARRVDQGRIAREQLDPEQVSWDEGKGYLYIEADVSEFSYNTILHASRGRYVVSARSVAWQRAWRSRWHDRARTGPRSREESGRA